MTLPTCCSNLLESEWLLMHTEGRRTTSQVIRRKQVLIIYGDQVINKCSLTFKLWNPNWDSNYTSLYSFSCVNIEHTRHTFRSKEISSVVQLWVLTCLTCFKIIITFITVIHSCFPVNPGTINTNKTSSLWFASSPAIECYSSALTKDQCMQSMGDGGSSTNKIWKH